MFLKIFFGVFVFGSSLYSSDRGPLYRKAVLEALGDETFCLSDGRIFQGKDVKAFSSEDHSVKLRTETTVYSKNFLNAVLEKEKEILDTAKNLIQKKLLTSDMKNVEESLWKLRSIAENGFSSNKQNAILLFEEMQRKISQEILKSFFYNWRLARF